MKVKVLKKQRQFEVVNAKDLGIQAYSDGNDYPQDVYEIVNGSGTGKKCVNVYAKFIGGKGFKDVQLAEKVINRKLQTTDLLSKLISQDYAMYGGFALHLNYNANFRISEIQYIPFENIRFEKLDDNGYFNRVAEHEDWGKRKAKLKKFKKDDITFIDLFNPDPQFLAGRFELCEGVQNYNGQVLYFSNEGEKTYPTPIFAPVLTDMSTEEGLSNVSYRNTRNNFLPSGMIIDKRNVDESDEQENETENSFKEFQGDEKACKIIYVQVSNDEEKPEFVSFASNNYDKDFTETRKAVKSSIGEVFNQPPILRGEDVGGNFGADLVTNAYDYYNSVIESERLDIERTFTQIFKYWWEPTNYSFEIEPLSYANNKIEK